MELLQEIATQVGIDHTFYHQFLTIAVLYLLLSSFYLKPFQRLLEKRKHETEGAKKEAEEMTSLAEQKFGEYKTRLKSVYSDAKDATSKIEQEAKNEEARIVSQANATARQSVQQTQQSLDQQKQNLMQEISSDIKNIAALIADKVLGKAVAASKSSNGNGRH